MRWRYEEEKKMIDGDDRRRSALEDKSFNLILWEMPALLFFIVVHEGEINSCHSIQYIRER